MARNQEKAQAMLNKVLAAKQEEARGPKQKRPHLASMCNDLNEADKWRQQILREIGRKVMEIQNAALGEHSIRDVNDEINRLIREKGHWEKRIMELGGPDYTKGAAKVTDSEGQEMAEATGKGAGYRYFGAAKQLPGVRELFEKEAPVQARRNRAQMYRGIDPDYYGFRDEEDGLLVKVEAGAEVKAMAEWQAKEAERFDALKNVKGGMAGVDEPGSTPMDEDAPQFIAYVPLPDAKDIEACVMQKKKADLLAQYTSEALQKEQQEAKDLLNKR